MFECESGSADEFAKSGSIGRSRIEEFPSIDRFEKDINVHLFS
jgi:hypothetical protein